MRSSVTIAGSATALLGLLVRPVTADAETVYVTPHASYSSSVGVLGCKINTDRVAYWPAEVDCNNLCVSLSYGGRSLYLLRIDHSGGAHDVSYDAWNYLLTGKSATEDPIAGGATAMTTETVDMANCADLLHAKADGKTALPLSASNSMNYLNSCLEQQAAGNDSWVAQHYALFNIADPLCLYGYDEPCSLDDWPSQNQATCHHALGAAATLSDATPVYNIEYPSGTRVLAGGAAVPASSSTASASKSTAAANNAAASSAVVLVASWTAVGLASLVHSLVAGFL
ncbi:hypothetical protein CMQ_3276 [Grosmannia clavigera kw1407]|uniref:Cerato-platanin n=1 Tax=Grosmannia clavigera (strain kw1407 / UAMH 11150) TaxID=655863 RepID=F0X9P9_GROCL|nr:uncharacterized protein CMQ_3276 [Grosmannia clavigera kw1407]EFX05207.1 hypothetical protein CMQ_3276 [Grosmannia clavigera kw1407]